MQSLGAEDSGLDAIYAVRGGAAFSQLLQLLGQAGHGHYLEYSGGAAHRQCVLGQGCWIG